jgi:hypothetical protein
MNGRLCQRPTQTELLIDELRERAAANAARFPRVVLVLVSDQALRTQPDPEQHSAALVGFGN